MSQTANTATTANTKTMPKAEPNSPVVDRAKEVGHGTIDRVSESAAKTEETLRETAAEADRRLREMGAQAQQTAEEQTKVVKNYIRENPLASAGIAFAAGIVLSGILRR